MVAVQGEIREIESENAKVGEILQCKREAACHGLFVIPLLSSRWVYQGNTNKNSSFGEIIPALSPKKRPVVKVFKACLDISFKKLY